MVAQDVVDFAEGIRDVVSLHPINSFQSFSGMGVVESTKSFRLRCGSRAQSTPGKYSHQCRYGTELEKSPAIEVIFREFQSYGVGLGRPDWPTPTDAAPCVRRNELGRQREPKEKARSGAGIDSWGIRRSSGLFRRADELEFHHGGIGFNQWPVVCHCDLVGLGVAQRRLDWTGSAVVARNWNAMETRTCIS